MAMSMFPKAARGGTRPVAEIEAAQRLAAEEQAQSRGTASGAVSLGSTLLGAIIGGLVTAGNPAGIAAGATIGGTVGGVGSAVINPSMQSAAGATQGLASSGDAYKRLLALIKEKEQSGLGEVVK